MVLNFDDQTGLIDTFSDVSSYQNSPTITYPDVDNQIEYYQQRSYDIDHLQSGNRLNLPPVQRRNAPNLGPLPNYSTIIGICDDGLPLLFDLTNPTAGCILILGNVNSGKFQLLKSILYSASLLNVPRDVNYYVVSPDPARFSDLTDYDHCSGVFSSYERSARELVIELASIAEQRKSGRHRGAVIILAIDDLYTFLKNREFEVDIHLKWLLKQGPNNGVWCIGTLQPEYLNKLKSDLLHSFKTRLIANTSPLSLDTGNKLLSQQLYPDTFKTQIGNQSINFWIPEY